MTIFELVSGSGGKPFQCSFVVQADLLEYHDGCFDKPGSEFWTILFYLLILNFIRVVAQHMLVDSPSLGLVNVGIIKARRALFTVRSSSQFVRRFEFTP